MPSLLEVGAWGAVPLVIAAQYRIDWSPGDRFNDSRSRDPPALDDPVVTRLSVTPIKGLGMCSAREIRLIRTGAVGDRQRFLVVDDDRLLSVTRSGAQLCAHSRLESDGELVVAFEDGELSGPIVLGPAVSVDFYGRTRSRDTSCRDRGARRSPTAPGCTCGW
jgi:hypothetical protein